MSTVAMDPAAAPSDPRPVSPQSHSAESSHSSSSPLNESVGSAIRNSNVGPEHVFLRAGATTQQVSAQECNATNAWRNGDGTEFRVRIGPNYAKHGKKDFSSPQMYDLIAVDIVRCPRRICPIAPIFDLPHLSAEAEAFQDPDIPSLLIINVQCPDCPAPIFGGSKDDGQTMHVVMFYQIRQDTIDSYTGAAPEAPAHDLFRRWCRDGFKDDKLRHRLKMIGIAENFRSLGMPTMLEGYNGKPALITKTGNVYKGKSRSFLEIGINVHQFPFLTKKFIYALRHKMKDMLLHIGGTVEGRNDEELPERMLFCVHVMKIDGFNKRVLSLQALEWLQKEAERLGHNESTKSG